MAEARALKLPVEVDLTFNCAVVGPGDSLVLRLSPNATPADAEDARRHLAEMLPGVNVIMLSGSAVEQQLVVVPGGASA